jgi:amino acid adenylation domain-containing protein
MPDSAHPPAGDGAGRADEPLPGRTAAPLGAPETLSLSPARQRLLALWRQRGASVADAPEGRAPDKAAPRAAPSRPAALSDPQASATALRLPADRPRRASGEVSFDSLEWIVPPEASAAIAALASRTRTDPLDVLLAATAVLAVRLAGEDGVAIVAAIAPEPRAAGEGPVTGADGQGLRVAVASAECFRAVLERVRDTHATTRASGVQRPLGAREATGAPVEAPELALSVAPAGAGLTVGMRFRADLFDRDTIARYAGYCGNLVAAACADPDRPIAGLALMDAAERERMLVAWNDTARAQTIDRPMHALFEAQVRRTPGAAAIATPDGCLTYDALNRRTNRLAHWLRAAGVAPDVRVALRLGRTADMVVGMLATMKAGGAYVPLDPSYPRARLAAVTTDAAPALILTDADAASAVPDATCRVVELSRLADALDGMPDVDPEPRAGADDLAYVIYTSGSTGAPKGVEVTHGGLANALLGIGESIGQAARDAIVALATPSFDIAGLELYLPLIVGGRVELASRDEARDPALLMARLRACRPALLQATPATWRMLIDAGWQGDPHTTVLCGGEALTRALADALLARAPAVWNLYGPTETTIYSTIERIVPGSEEITIGRPIANTQVYVLDGQLEPVPVGAPGELYIGGAGVARGYRGNPALTAERFVPDPFGTAPGARLYRTGDLARVRADGRLVHLGRRDHQVKIRGFRIELGDVEAALAACEGVRHCAVVAHDDGTGFQQLVAYVVADDADAAGLRRLGEQLGGRLPAYMVPTRVVPLAALPLTPNGKVDRRALPAPRASAADGEPLAEPVAVASGASPREMVAAVWRALLGVEAIGPDDDFFALGGHSLLAARMVARIGALSGRKLPLRAVFDAPTLAGVADALALAPEWTGGPSPARTSAGGEFLPLTAVQRGLWYLDALTEGRAPYSMHLALRVKGDLDAQALTRALQDLVRRHAALRTRFLSEDGVPLQQVCAATPLALPVHALADASPASADSALHGALVEALRRPFDLTAGTPMRAWLYRLDAREHALLLVVHHIVGDGWSMGVLAHELGALYDAHAGGSPAALAPLPLQFAEYVRWEREQAAAPAMQAHLAYWRERLDGLAPLQLPLDRPRPAQQSFAGALHRLRIDAPVHEGLKALARREGTTLFMVLLAAFQVLLSRYSGQHDVAVGTPVAGRTRAEFEGLFGDFVNTVVMRTDLSGEPDFVGLLARVRDGALDAYTHQDLPFERLVGELSPVRDAARNPLYQVSFALRNLPDSTVSLHGLEVAPIDVHPGTSKFDLSLEMEEVQGALLGSVEYSTDLFDASTIARMMRHWATLLEAIVADPRCPVARLPLMDARERDQVLGQFGEGPAPQDVPVTAHAAIEAQARRSPDAAAVCCDGRTLAYGELNRQANRLAHRLRELGVGPDVPVALCLPRSQRMVVGLLAILKAGGAWVPLDPAYPDARLCLMVRDCGAPVVLTEHGLRTRLAGGDDAPAAQDRLPRPVTVLSLDTEWPAIAERYPATDPTPLAALDHLAYVIYTSGSTGTPKGVAITHRAIGHHMRWILAMIGLEPADRLLQKTSIGFDASVWEVLGPLQGGATLVLPAQEATTDPASLAQAVRTHGITLLQVVPSMLRALVEEGLLAACGSLRLLACGGEALDRALAREARRQLPATRLCNLYGPTEATIDATWHEVIDPPEGVGHVPIGRPIAGTRCRVLDGHGQPVPIGVVGELHLGGAGLARGYLNRPELTAERFVTDPLRPGERLYRTGDLARYLPDGTIDFVGRVDHQVKLRGLRIEPGEIEAVIAACEGVSQCVAMVREDRPGLARLVAYVVGQGWREAAVRARIGQVLPAYMVPSAIVAMPALPLTPHGKVDRRALPRPADEDAASQVAPGTPVEVVLAGLWGELLGRPRIGVHDDFFALGGHSLLGSQLIARVRSRYGVTLPLRALFDTPTIAGLATRVEAALRAGTGMAAPVSQAAPEGDADDGRAVPHDGVPGADGDPLPMSAAQEGLWYVDRLTEGRAPYNVPVAFRLSGALDVAALTGALCDLVARHDALRAQFLLREGARLLQVVPPMAVPLTVREVPGTSMQARERTLQALLREDAVRPFDLRKAPLLRACLYPVGERAHVLLVVMHHIVSDGWSLGVLARELGALYDARAAGGVARLPALSARYADHVREQRAQLATPATGAHLTYWRERLAGLSPLQLPLDRPRPARSSFAGGQHRFVVDAALLAALRTLARREGATLFMALLAGFQALLGRYSGQHDVAVGTPVAGRSHAEYEGLIGYFVNTLVMRTDLSGDPGFTTLLARVRDGALDAYTHQALPFDRLVAELSPVREASRNPLYQVSFALQNTPDSPLAMAGLDVVPMPLDTGTAKFDLSLSLVESGGTLQGTIDFSTDLFESATIVRIATHFVRLLSAVVAQPHVAVARLPLMDAAERACVLEQWNDTGGRALPGHALPARFEAQVRRAPDAPAVICGARRLSYDALNRRANRLAHHLRALGVGPEVPVALCLDRSERMVVALLAILKAGGAYVPLDPEYPAQRLALMLADSGAPVLLTERVQRERLPHEAGPGAPHVLSLDEDWPPLEAGFPDDDPAPQGGPDALAYVLYTSGSTGTPKGVMVPHRAIASLVIDTDFAPLGPDDCVAQGSNCSFDAATWEIWGALLNGSRLVVVSRDVLLSPMALGDLIRDEGVSAMFVTTALFNEYARTAPSVFAGLRLLVFGGEAADPHAVTAIARAQPPARLFNAYGPTETTTFATAYEVPIAAWRDAADDDGRGVRGRLPIGRPLTRVRCHVLDAHGEPVPVGVVGELHIGGAGLARGYLNRPALSAERFVDDPLRPGERLYRTGDLARYRADGAIDFIGRIDHQVKLRGLRIELGEIEAALGACAGVAQAVVSVDEDPAGERRLVAHVVPADEAAAPEAGALRDALAQKLPAFMLPSAFVTVAAMPLTANGKIDRARLPAPAIGLRAVAAPASEPDDPLVARLREIWEHTLDVRPIGADDDFFALGGHSLLAVRLFDEIATRLGYTLRLASLFQAPTLRAQAALLRRDGWGASSCVVAIRAQGRRAPLFFVSGWGGAIAPLHALARELDPDQPLYVLDIGAFGTGDTAPTIPAIAARMIEDMRAVQPAGPYRLAGFSLGGAIVHEMAQQLVADGGQVALLALLDSAAPGYPPMRPVAVRVAMHVAHAIRLGPRRAIDYLRTRFVRLRRFAGHDPRTLFDAATLPQQGAVARAMEDAAQAVYRAWRGYVPRWYPGRVWLIRAEVRDYGPGVLDTDPAMGWERLSGGGVIVASLPCLHQRMLDAAQAPALAACLERWLRADDVRRTTREAEVEAEAL